DANTSAEIASYPTCQRHISAGGVIVGMEGQAITVARECRSVHRRNRHYSITCRVISRVEPCVSEDIQRRARIGLSYTHIAGGLNKNASAVVEIADPEVLEDRATTIVGENSPCVSEGAKIELDPGS